MASRCGITEHDREVHQRKLGKETQRQQNELQREVSDPRTEIKDKICLGTNK